MYRLITQGKVAIGKQTLKMDYFPEMKDTLRNYSMNKTPIMYDSSFEGFDLFGKHIDLSERYHIRWYSNQVDVLDDHKACVHSIYTIVYDPEMINAADIELPDIPVSDSVNEQ